MIRTRALLGLLLLAGASLAQDADRESPRDVFLAFFRYTDAYRAGEDEALTRAGELFDLSDVTAGNREWIGRNAARDLRNFLDRVVVVDFFQIPAADYAEETYTFETPRGDVVLEKLDGGWHVSARTLDEADDLLYAARDLAPADGETLEDTSTWLRRQMPEWLRERVFLIEHWQWLGLLALALLGVLAGVIVRLFFTGVVARLARRRGRVIDESPRTGRPFSMVGMALLWWALLHFLALPPRVYEALSLAIRLVLMFGFVWALCRVVDWVAQGFRGFARRTESKLDDLLVPMVRKAVKVFVVAIGIVWIADNVGMDIAALLAGLGIGGVAIALASKDTVENFFGAAAILADRPFQVGDWIRMGDIEGTVEEVGFRSTRVRTFYNSKITFPNALLIRSAVDNLGEREYRRVREVIGVTYDTPPDKLAAFVEGIRELIRIHPYTRKDYYHVYFHAFGASALEILIYCFLRCPDWGTELRERQRLMLDILRLAESLGVEFAFPTQTLHVMRDTPPEHGERRSVPEAHRHGRSAAREIVERFTGEAVPPPVVIGKRPDAEADDGE